MRKTPWTLGLVWVCGCAAAGESGGDESGTLNGWSDASVVAALDASASGTGDTSLPAVSTDASAAPSPDAAPVTTRDAAASSQDAGSTSTATPGGPEVCDNGRDDDLDGLVDENCACKPGANQACYFGPAESAGNLCPQGKQACAATAEFAFWGPCSSTGAPFPKDACACYPETCDNAKDDNCNGLVDEGCAVEVPVDIDGDCVTARCPAWAPYPVGCALDMEGGDSRGCVANAQGSPEVYFQEGDACPILGGILGGLGGDVGHIRGKLLCSSQQGAPLDAQRCTLNKPEKIFPSSASGCP